MGRKKKYDPEKVLRQAMEIFWYTGFEATSVAQLSKQLGVSLQSIYDTWGSKEGLFLDTLDFYEKITLNLMQNDLLKEDASFAEIEGRFENFLHIALSTPIRKTCFACYSAQEQGLRNEEIRIKTKHYLQTIKEAFERAISNAQNKGEIFPSLDANAVAWSMVNGIAGLGSLSRSGLSEEILQLTIIGLLSPLQNNKT